MSAACSKRPGPGAHNNSQPEHRPDADDPGKPEHQKWQICATQPPANSSSTRSKYSAFRADNADDDAERLIAIAVLRHAGQWITMRHCHVSYSAGVTGIQIMGMTVAGV
jgi:hypothetical protein